MKKLFCVFCILAILLSLSSCNRSDSPETDEKPKTSKKPKPDDTPEVDDRPTVEFEGQKYAIAQPISKMVLETERTGHTTVSKDHVPEFIALMGGERELVGLLSGRIISEETCYNVTPPLVAQQTDIQIFKFSDSCLSFVLVDGEIYELCGSFGGYGFVDAIPWNFDNDDVLDLLVCASWGSGVHRSEISVFNPVTKESTLILSSLDTIDPYADIVVYLSAPVLSSMQEKYPVYFHVTTIDISLNDEKNYNFADLSWTLKEDIGYIIMENGEPVFVPWEE